MCGLHCVSTGISRLLKRCSDLPKKGCEPFCRPLMKRKSAESAVWGWPCHLKYGAGVSRPARQKMNSRAGKNLMYWRRCRSLLSCRCICVTMILPPVLQSFGLGSTASLATICIALWAPLSVVAWCLTASSMLAVAVMPARWVLCRYWLVQVTLSYSIVLHFTDWKERLNKRA